MLDLGFLPPIRRIVSHLTSRRQSLFFSATMPREIGRLADELLRDPARIAVAPVATLVDSVTQRVIHVESGNKLSLLVQLLGDPQMSRALVFTRTKRRADRVARHLRDRQHRRRRHPRRQEPAAARACARGLSRLEGPRSGGDRHRRARHRHRSGHARGELRAAGRSGELRPPHRPHRARRCRGHRHLALRRGRARAAARHRATDPAVDPGRGSAPAEGSRAAEPRVRARIQASRAYASEGARQLGPRQTQSARRGTRQAPAPVARGRLPSASGRDAHGQGDGAQEHSDRGFAGADVVRHGRFVRRSGPAEQTRS